MNLDKTPISGRLLFDGGRFCLLSDKVECEGGGVILIKEDGSIVNKTGNSEKIWKPRKPAEGMPVYAGSFPVLNAVYDLALQELDECKNPDGTFSTGKEWNTIWTRDTAYSTYLGLSFVDSGACRKTLEKRIAVNGEIEQDTGTGGSWPVSTDRVIWGIAAWEVYLMDGDHDWLSMACHTLEETCLHDDLVVCDLVGLMRGESSFLDWREQSYPEWMTPSDIAESVALSTMVLHRKARAVLYEMYTELGRLERADYWRDQGEKLDLMIERLFWVPLQGIYGQFIYGRGYPVLSERVDNLGEALCVLFDVARGERAKQVVANMPRCPMGIPCFYPLKNGGGPAYHNDAVWPLVEGAYVMAAAKVRNGDAVMAGLASLTRLALCCGTNKENVHIHTGGDEGLVSSSDRQLWSIAAVLGSFYKGLFGIGVCVNELLFTPCVPDSLKGRHELKGLVWRDLTFDLVLDGSGSEILSCTINGKEALPVLSCSCNGHYTVEIVLGRQTGAGGSVRQVSVAYDLPVPAWGVPGVDLAWNPVEGADYYRVYRNGVPIAQTEETVYVPLYPKNHCHYQVMAVSLDGRESFLNEPHEYVPNNARVETRPSGLSGDDVWVSRIENSSGASFHDIMIARDGVYRVDAYYANGTGSLRDGNTCALRSLFLNGERAGSIIMPHLGEPGQWDHLGYSSGLEIFMSRGVYKVEMSYQVEDENINYFVNTSLIKNLRFTRIGD